MNAEKAFELQNNIKINQLEYQDFVSDIDKWIQRRSNKTDKGPLLPTELNKPVNIQLDNPETAKSYKQIGNSYHQNGEYHNAVSAYSTALHADPTNHVLYANRAMSYIKLQLFDNAIADCDSCLALDRTFTKAIYRRAVAYLKTARYELAIIDARAFLRHQPSHLEAVSLLQEALALLEARKLVSTGEYNISVDEVASRVVIPTFGSFEETGDMRKIVLRDAYELKGELINEVKHVTCPKSDTYNEVEADVIVSHLETPKNYAEFEKTVNGVCDSLLVFYKYFTRIPPAEYVRLFGEMLESNVLGKIVNALNEYEWWARCVIVSDHVRVVEVLEGLSKVRRFSFVVLFLGDEKNVIHGLIASCGGHVNDERIATLKQLYI